MAELRTALLVRRIQENILSVDELRRAQKEGRLPPCTAFAAGFLAAAMGWTQEEPADD